MNSAYELVWRCKGITDGCASIQEMIYRMEAATDELRQMQFSQTELDQEDDYAFFWTDSASLASKFGFCKFDLNDDDDDDETEPV